MPGGELDPGRRAALADALEEAGGGRATVARDGAGHLLGPGPHVRACWVLDLLTGRG